MSNIPNGYMTFLFTDIEGSTKLAQEFYETLPDILKKHNSILHTVIEINNGFVFKTIGDAFYCAFENSADAVKAAVEVQIKLSSEKWNEAVYEQAQKYYEESLILGMETGCKDEIFNSLIGFAGILCGNKLSVTVMLLGAVETELESVRTILDREEKVLKIIWH